MSKPAVIVTTYRRVNALQKCLAALLPQAREAGAFVVVVDDGTPGGMAKHAKGADRYIWQPDRGYRLATARNVGARAALEWGADVLCFLDGDLVVDDGWMDTMACAGDLAIGTVNGAHLLSDKLHGTRPWLAFTGGNCVVSSEMWSRCGGYDERFNGAWGCEDTEFAYRAGAFPVAQANVTHRKHAPRENWQAEQANNWQKFADKHGSENVGQRPNPVRTDVVATVDTTDVLDGVAIVTATRGRPEEVERWKVERLTWPIPFVVGVDGGWPYDGLPHVDSGMDTRGRTWTRSFCSLTPLGTSHITRACIDCARAGGCTHIIELDDHDCLPNGLEDIKAIARALKDGADYVYTNWIATDPESGSRNPTVAPDYQPGMCLDTGMRWQGAKAYTVAAYQEVGGYRAEEFPAGDFALALRFELAGKRMERVATVWTECPVTAGSLTFSRKGEAGENVRKWQEAARKGEYK